MNQDEISLLCPAQQRKCCSQAVDDATLEIIAQKPTLPAKLINAIPALRDQEFRAGCLIPIHFFEPKRYGNYFDNVEIRSDGEWWTI